MPEVSADFRTWTVKVKPGIYFADDPAFNGKKRELVAEDYVYALKRFFDPRWKAPAFASLNELRMLGLGALRGRVQGEIESLEQQDARAFSHHEAVARAVKWA